MQHAARINWLDGWRAIAVSLVILSHAVDFYGLDNVPVPGMLGVFIFFSISGYIVTKVLLNERSQSGGINSAHFYTRRALRIVPPLLVYLAVCLALFWPNVSIQLGALRAAAFSCNLWIPFGKCGLIFGHTWSLAFEEQFYLLLPFIFLNRWNWRTSALLILTLFLVAAPFLWPLPFVGRIGFVQIYLLLALGALYARFEGKIAPLLSRTPAPVALAAIVLAGAWMELPPGKLRMLTGLVVAPAIVIGVFALPLRSPFFAKFLSSWPLRTIGLYSYTLYLWQQFAFLRTEWNVGAVPLMMLAAAFLIAGLSYHTVEAGCRRIARALRSAERDDYPQTNKTPPPAR